MSVIEFLGFIITMVAMVAIVFKKSMDERDRRKNPEKFREKENGRKENLKQLLKSLNLELEDEEDEEEEVERVHTPPPRPQQLKNNRTAPAKVQRPLGDTYANRERYDNYRTDTSVGTRKLKSEKEERERRFSSDKIVSPDFLRKEQDAYVISSKYESSRGANILKNMRSKKDMMIVHEIFSRPKSEIR